MYYSMNCVCIVRTSSINCWAFTEFETFLSTFNHSNCFLNALIRKLEAVSVLWVWKNNIGFWWSDTNESHAIIVFKQNVQENFLNLYERTLYSKTPAGILVVLLYIVLLNTVMPPHNRNVKCVTFYSSSYRWILSMSVYPLQHREIVLIYL